MNNPQSVAHHENPNNNGILEQQFGTLLSTLDTTHMPEIQKISETRKEQDARLRQLRTNIIQGRERRMEVEDEMLEAIAKELGEEDVEHTEDGRQVTRVRGETEDDATSKPVQAGEKGRRRPAKAPARARAASKPHPKPPTKKQAPTARLARRSQEEIDKLVEAVVGLTKRHPDGLRAENIRQELELQAKEMPRILRRGLDLKKLKATGQKRATVYTLGVAAVT